MRFGEINKPFKSPWHFLAWVLIGACLYAVDCLLVNDAPNVPWIERGIYAGRLFLLTVVWFVLVPLIDPSGKGGSDRQPRG
jgi:hypothetical protein